jgi:hypothetical protein
VHQPCVYFSTLSRCCRAAWIVAGGLDLNPRVIGSDRRSDVADGLSRATQPLDLIRCWGGVFRSDARDPKRWALLRHLCCARVEHQPGLAHGLGARAPPGASRLQLVSERRAALGAVALLGVRELLKHPEGARDASSLLQRPSDFRHRQKQRVEPWCVEALSDESYGGKHDMVRHVRNSSEPLKCGNPLIG